MSPATITLLFLLFAIVMFVWEKIPLGVTSMIICVGLVVTGVLDWKTAFAGFIDSNVILFVAMFIVGGALFETGERCAFQHRNSSSFNSGSYRNCSKVRIFKIKAFNAACICSSDGRQPFFDRSAGKPDCTVRDGRDGHEF